MLDIILSCFQQEGNLVLFFILSEERVIYLEKHLS